MTNILWLRRDLQLADNASLHRALLEEKPVQPVFIFDTEILSRFKNKSDRRLTFIAHAIANLHSELTEKGGGVLILHGNPKDIIPQIAKQFSAKVFAGEDYEPGPIKRDTQVKEQCSLILQKQHVLISPDEVLKSDGIPYKVFTPYSKAWHEKIKSLETAPIKIRDKDRYANFATSVKTAKSLGLKVIDSSGAKRITAEISYDYVDDEIWKPENASKLLKTFEGKIDDYYTQRNFPAIRGTSKLSPYLRFGLVTPRQAYTATLRHQKSGAWINELIWREFYMMILFHFPETANQEFIHKYRGLEWKTNKEHLKKWKEGKTGYPIIDAGMRQLLKTGWMHNRVRMIVASFLTKDLLIDWREGEEHFAQYLIDYEMASNVGGWQWAASTGTDSAPYFRIFNPVLQSKKFDADGAYIKKYVPELKDIPAKSIHDPTSAQYMEKIIEHEKVKPQVLELFKSYS